jgi:hypothetical protein
MYALGLSKAGNAQLYGKPPAFRAKQGEPHGAANDRTWMTGLDRSEAGAEASRAKARKVLPAALRCASMIRARPG